ncbi:DUF3987 domain-containing protein [Parabacteroides sp.]|uniref:DUF3987 domain-containing protein n=1 Tax=Parabacteroides sp. TaxID=1869337 RepID=UPI0025800B63|nr:DUF3987 domain-containing protein [Parabacteroides sp.]
MTPLSHLARLVDTIERQGANIAPTYQEYMPIAFAIANDCGEAGRPFFHRICRLSEKYVSGEADKLYDHALKAGNGRNGLGSVFHWAEIAGVKADKQLTDIARNYAEKRPETCELANLRPPHPLTHTCAHEAYINMPVFGNYDWPPFLNQLIDCGDSPAQRDILLLGAVTVLGATLNKRLRILYGRKYHYPCLQTFIVAPPASGKGALTWVRHLGEPIHEAMMEEFKALRKEYRLEKVRWGALGKKRTEKTEPEEPRPKMFLIAGDNSGTGVLENLIEADGVGLICETEADTVSTAIGTDYGHWSDTLRKCYDHDRLAFNRRMNHEYKECSKSFLSVLLSGTPAQVKPLIPSAENGLFSRQIFYYMPAITEWVDQFDLSDEDYGSRFTGWGKQWKAFVEWLGTSVNLIQLKLSKEQKSRFNERFAQLFGHAGFTHGGAMRSTVARIAINICRILSVVALLRAVEKVLPPKQEIFNAPFSILNCPGLSPSGDIPEENVRDGIVPKLDLIATEADFEAVLNLTEPLYRHACHILSILPATDVRQREPTPQEALFDALPLAFNRQEALREAKRIGMGTDTLDSHLRRMLEKGVILKNARGQYIFTAKQRQTPQSPL